jgi:hypothetical protein
MQSTSAIITVLSFAALTYGEDANVVWHTTWAAAQEEARAAGKPIFAIVNCRQCPDQGKWNAEVLRWVDSEPAVARHWVLFRPGTVRGLDLTIFEFDYDLNWQGLFLTHHGQALGRFGGRDAKTPGKYFSLPGLKYALSDALVRFRKGELPPIPRGPADHAENYEASTRLPRNACIHCHHVNEFRREAQRKAGTWKLDDVWVYPEPENIGLTLDRDQGNCIVAVAADSSAARAGLKAGDVLRHLGTTAVASVVDVQYALHHAPPVGRIRVAYQRGTAMEQADVELAEGWRKTDLTWRWSLKQLAPAPQIHGDDLTAEERKPLGLTSKQLAFRQGNYLTKTARQAGLRIGDVILGVNGKMLEMRADEFDLHIRLHFRPGDTVTYLVQRGEDRIEISVKLSE